jgi:hypothetical protein
MSKLEDLKRRAAVKSTRPDCPVTVANIQSYESAAAELAVRGPAGNRVADLLVRRYEPNLEVSKVDCPRRSASDGRLFRPVLDPFLSGARL